MFLENSEIRWVDDAMAAAMVRDVALEMVAKQIYIYKIKIDFQILKITS